MHAWLDVCSWLLCTFFADVVLSCMLRYHLHHLPLHSLALRTLVFHRRPFHHHCLCVCLRLQGPVTPAHHVHNQIPICIYCMTIRLNLSMTGGVPPKETASQCRDGMLHTPLVLSLCYLSISCSRPLRPLPSTSATLGLAQHSPMGHSTPSVGLLMYIQC